MPYLAVYGTLKKGHSNHDVYLKDAKFIGKGITVEKYVLVEQVIPFCIPPNKVEGGEKIASRIKVEVYEVNEETLRKIDKLEGHPNWYIRKLIDIEMETGETVKAWFYEYPQRIEGRIIRGVNGVAEF